MTPKYSPKLWWPKKYPQNLHTPHPPPKKNIFLNTPKYIEIQNFEPKKYVCMKISEYPPPLGPESELSSRRFCMWRFLVLLSLFHKVFWVRCGTNCIDSWHLPSSLLFILTQVPTHKKYRILCYPLRSNSGWLPIRCAYFILVISTTVKRQYGVQKCGVQ